MLYAPEQLVALNKANLETTLALANVALEGVERLANLQLSVAKDALAESAKTARALATAKDIQEFVALQPSYETAVEKTLDYSRSVYEVASQTQSEINRLVQARIEELHGVLSAVLDKAIKSAPAGSDLAVAAIKSAMEAANTAYDNIQKAAKQVTEITETSVPVATAAIEKAAGSSKKKAK